MEYDEIIVNFQPLKAPDFDPMNINARGLERLRNVFAIEAGRLETFQQESASFRPSGLHHMKQEERLRRPCHMDELPFQRVPAPEVLPSLAK